MIRLLRAEEIECRIATVSEKGVSVLLFKDARVDQKILDETFTPFGWKRTHQEIGGNLYCTVEVWDKERQQWISKQDVGTENYSEKEKGQASDSFKRACFNWGIGRELYTAPFIWIPASSVEIRPRGDKYFCNERFSVSRIAYDENRVISELTIVNNRKQSVYTYKGGKTRAVEKPASMDGNNADGIGTSASETIAGGGGTTGGISGSENIGGKDGSGTRTLTGKTGTVGNGARKNGGGINKDRGLSLAQMAELERELKRTGVPLQMVLDRYLLSSLNEMTEANFEGAMKGLLRTKSKNQRAA